MKYREICTISYFWERQREREQNNYRKRVMIFHAPAHFRTPAACVEAFGQQKTSAVKSFVHKFFLIVLSTSKKPMIFMFTLLLLNTYKIYPFDFW